MTSQSDEIEEEQISRVEKGEGKEGHRNIETVICTSPSIVRITQKLIAEMIGTYFIVFSGCGVVVVNVLYGRTITFPGVCVVWGLIVMVMIYSTGHISAAHFNPAVTVTFAIFRRFPWYQVPLYIGAQLTGSLIASLTLRLMFKVTPEAYFGTTPADSPVRALVAELITSFLLMFVISGVSTDNRAVGGMAGIAVGMTLMLNVFVAGPISGASMNPARSLGPAIVMGEYKHIWVYIIGPVIGVMSGGFVTTLSDLLISHFVNSLRVLLFSVVFPHATKILASYSSMTPNHFVLLISFMGLFSYSLIIFLYSLIYLILV